MESHLSITERASKNHRQSCQIFVTVNVVLCFPFWDFFFLYRTKTSVFRKLEWSLKLSLCVLYSMIVFNGKLRTLLRVSLILIVVTESFAVLFQTEIISSWDRMETTAPQISSPTINCSPRMARIRFSQHLDARPFLNRTIHLPPSLLASSWEREREN